MKRISLLLLLLLTWSVLFAVAEGALALDVVSDGNPVDEIDLPDVDLYYSQDKMRQDVGWIFRSGNAKWREAMQRIVDRNDAKPGRKRRPQMSDFSLRRVLHSEASPEIPAKDSYSTMVPIDEDHFPDRRFLGYIKDNFDVDSDGMLSQSEIARATEVDISGKSISSLKGIDTLTGLKTLRCARNSLSALDVGKCRSLVYLDCSENNLKSLDVGACAALEYLNCSDNKLEKLSLHNNTGLIRLYCNGNMLTGIDISDNKALRVLDCKCNPIDAIDVASLPATLGKLALRSDIRMLQNGGLNWKGAHDCALCVPALVTLSNGEKIIYKKEDLFDNLRVSNSRSSYAGLTDAQFANFRNVATTGMGKNALYRSSSPIDTALGRNKEAMAAMKDAGIRSVINLSDSSDAARQREDYPGSYYASTDLWARKMDMKFGSKHFKRKFASSLRFMAEHRGPYLVHCVWGMDRTGFVCAILECLMGADANEVVREYMLTFENYYGIYPGTAEYRYIAQNRISQHLALVFGVNSINDSQISLSVCAEQYLTKCGLTDEEISVLKKRLATEY